MADKEDSKKSEGKTEMTKEDAARIQRAEAKKHGGGVEKGSFPARAQRAAAKNEAAGKGEDKPET